MQITHSSVCHHETGISQCDTLFIVLSFIVASQSPETCPFTLNISKEELCKLPIKHGAEVYIFTEVDGQESQEKGKVVFIGVWGRVKLCFY